MFDPPMDNQSHADRLTDKELREYVGSLEAAMSVYASDAGHAAFVEEQRRLMKIVAVLKAECLASREMDRVDNNETRTDSDMREAWATLKAARAATDTALPEGL